MFKRNVKLKAKPYYSSWDKVTIGSWRINGDSQVYCELKLPVAKALDYIKNKNQESDSKITITHFVGAVMGKVLRAVPDMNVLVRWNKIYHREEVNIFFQIADKKDLSGHCIHNADKKSIVEIAQELSQTAKNVRDNKDPNFKKIKSSWRIIPIQFSTLVIGFIKFILYGLNWHMKALGVPRDAFGSMMITNIGSLGFDSAFVPIAPYSHVPLIFALGKIKDEPICNEDGTIAAKKMVSICVTFDHRILEGYRGSLIAKEIKKYFADPQLLDL